MKSRITEFCRQKELLKQGDRILIGLSGGADSVCLFLVLSELAKEWDLELLPVHVNHNLRGEEAEQDRMFCERLCWRHNRELLALSVPVAELAKEQGLTLEEAGRNARYEAFRVFAEIYECDKIAVAHHKNDQAETVLFQLFRGSRVKGLSGMEAKNGNIIRPLLCVTRKEIEDYLAEKGQKYCIDRTNSEEEYTRNLIRHRMLPVAEEIQPRAVEHVADTAEYLGRVEKLLQRLTEELYSTCAADNGAEGVTLEIGPLRAAEGLLAERVVYQALCSVYGRKKDITAGLVADCMDLTEKQTGRYLTLPEGLVAKRQYDKLWIGPEIPAEDTPYRRVITDFPFRAKLPGKAGSLTLEVKNIADFGENFSEKIAGNPKSTYTKWFDYDKIERAVSLKTPEAEDTIVLYTDGRGKRVFDVLKEAKVPLSERKSLWVLAAGQEVLWIPGIRGSEGYYVTKETKRVLIATINGGKENG